VRHDAVAACQSTRRLVSAFRWHPHKYSIAPAAQRRVDGFTFDSKLEMDYYLYLEACRRFDDGITQPQIIHVDVHPKVTLGPGDRVEPDFLIWYADGRVEFIDCKGTDPKRLSEFRRLQARWRHPAGPLVGILRDGRGWKRMESER
jgi:hypothetical protein